MATENNYRRTLQVAMVVTDHDLKTLSDAGVSVDLENTTIHLPNPKSFQKAVKEIGQQSLYASEALSFYLGWAFAKGLTHVHFSKDEPVDEYFSLAVPPVKRRER